METISSHTVKYSTEKYFKNKLIKNLIYFDLGKKSEFKCTPQQSSNFKLYFKGATKAMLQNLKGTQLGFVEVSGLPVK